MSQTTPETPPTVAEPTTTEILGKVVEAIDAVQDAEATVVEEGRRLAAHLLDPNAHGRDISACIEQAVADHAGNAQAHGLDAVRETVTGLSQSLNTHIHDSDVHGGQSVGGLISLPAIAGQDTMAAGYEATYVLSASSGLVGGEIVEFEVLFNGETRTAVASDNVASVTLTLPAGAVGSYDITVRAHDSYGNISAISRKTVAAIVACVTSPKIVAPAAGKVVASHSLTLESCAFAVSGAQDTHVASYWRITADAAGTETIYESGRTTTDLVSHTATPPSPLPPATDIHVWVRHEGRKLGLSDWSSPVSARISHVLGPSLAEPATGTLVSTQSVLLRSTTFASYGGVQDTHIQSRWKVTTDADGRIVLGDSGWVNDLTEYAMTLNPPAPPNATLYLWVAHKGQYLGQSEWSATVQVRTGAVLRPNFVSPTAGSIISLSGLTLTGTPFAVETGTSDTMAASFWQIATDDTFGNLIYDSGRTVGNAVSHSASFAAQPQGTALFIRVRYEGEAMGPGPWSDALQVVTTRAHTPEVLTPTSGQTGIALRPTFTFSAYSDTGGLDVVAAVRVQLATTNDFSTLAADTGEIAAAESWTPENDLQVNTQYYVRLMYKGNKLGWTPWSATSAFRTIANRPPSGTITVTGPLRVAEKTSGNSLSFSGVTDPDGDAVTYSLTQSGAAQLTFSKTSGIAPGEAVTFSAPDVAADAVITVTVASRDAKGAAGPSTQFSITVFAVFIATPSITSPAEGATVGQYNVTFVSGAFSSTGNVAAHDSSSWEICKGAEVVRTIERDTVNKTSIVFPYVDKSSLFRSGAGPSPTPTTFYVRVRHHSNAYGDSAWSAPRKFLINL